MNFEGKRVLITGAAGGIGQVTVRLFKEAGARVAASDLAVQNPDADICLEGDLTEKDFAESLVTTAANAFNGLDILVNNAGIIRRGSVTESSDADFDISVAVNVQAPFRLSRAAIPLLAESGGGAIVNTASCWGLYPGSDHAIYCMTKAALASLTQCMGRDHAHQGIRVNAVCPNEVETPMLRSGFEKRGFDADTAIAELNKTVPLGRIAQPEDIAEVILFLASDHARYICGELIEINGGKPVG